MKEELELLRQIICGHGDYPKLLTHKGKHGDTHVVILTKESVGPAWLAMFHALDKWEEFYVDLDAEQAECYDKANQGSWQHARALLVARSSYEYEEVIIESIYTPLSLEKRLES
jgi:hypothetical protein